MKNTPIAPGCRYSTSRHARDKRYGTMEKLLAEPRPIRVLARFPRKFPIMDDIQKAAYIIAMSACAQAEAMGMLAENQFCASENRPPTYRFYDFEALSNKYGIHHNAVLTFFR